MVEHWMRGEDMLSLWLVLLVASGLVFGIVKGFFKARKIQPRGFKWAIFRNEIIFAAINVTLTGFILATVNAKLVEWGVIGFRHDRAAWWMIGLEYALYFFLFDTYFYWLHRWMHNEPFYSWVHKLHHRSTSPNLITTFSVSPLESLINGGFVPLFLAMVTVHDATMALIVPTNVIMGIYVHSGYELMPRWWNKFWATKWFITATFHDQHHRYFTGNFGGYTTIWDRLCGTMRPRFEADFDKIKARKNDRPDAATETPTAAA